MLRSVWLHIKPRTGGALNHLRPSEGRWGGGGGKMTKPQNTKQ